jgi:DNA polymerase-3 subunit beta
MKKIIINSFELKQTLKTVSKAIPQKPVLFILDNFKCEVLANCNRKVIENNYVLTHKSMLRISATDLENSLIAEMSCEANESFSFLLPKKALAALEKYDTQPMGIKLLEDYSVKFETEDGQFTFAGENADEFPIIPAGFDQVAIVEGPEFLTELNKHKSFRGSDPLRPNLTGTYFEIGEELRITSTDANILRTATFPALCNPASFILGKAACNLLSSFKSDYVEIFQNSNKTLVQIIVDGVYLISRTIDETYPAYSNVIPENGHTTATFSKTEMTKAIGRAAIFCNKTTKQIKLSINGALTVTSEEIDLKDSFTGIMPCTHTGEDIQIGFNHTYFTSILALEPETVTLQMNGPNLPAIIKSDNATSVIMPMLLKYESQLD